MSLKERLSMQAARWREQVARWRKQAAALPDGPEREELLQKARQADLGDRLDGWLTSRGLQPPK
jgi:hypothetical protein